MDAGRKPSVMPGARPIMATAPSGWLEAGSNTIGRTFPATFGESAWEFSAADKMETPRRKEKTASGRARLKEAPYQPKSRRESSSRTSKYALSLAEGAFAAKGQIRQVITALPKDENLGIAQCGFHAF
jgi:hypothetical protein